jgi:hypothetical protein
MQNMQNLHGNAESAFRSRNSGSRMDFRLLRDSARTRNRYDAGAARLHRLLHDRQESFYRRRTATGLQVRMPRRTTRIVFDF